MQTGTRDFHLSPIFPDLTPPCICFYFILFYFFPSTVERNIERKRGRKKKSSSFSLIIILKSSENNYAASIVSLMHLARARVRRVKVGFFLSLPLR